MPKIKRSQYCIARQCLAKHGATLKAPYQLEGVKWLLEHERKFKTGALLCDEMGLGKTIQTIALILGSSLKNTLLVLPASLIRQWEEQINKFASDMITVYTHHGTSRVFETEFDKHSKLVVITSYNLIINDNSKFSSVEWDRIILDECHYMRNSKSIIFDSLMKMKAQRKLGLTGTPIQNYMSDLVTLFIFLDYEKSTIYVEMERLIRLHILRRTKQNIKEFDEKLDLPPINVVSKLIRISKEERAHTDIIASYEFYPFETILRKKQSAISLQLLENGLAKKFKKQPKILKNTSTKLRFIAKKALEHCEKKDKVIIFTTFAYEVDYLQNVFQSRKIKVNHISGNVPLDSRKKIMDSTDTQVLIVQIVCGGTGLNLQQYNVALFTSPTWNPSLEEQAIGRLHRIGQTKPVTIYRVLCHRTIDKKIDTVQQIKRKMINQYIK